ncbi:MAG TPA: hypothetical protein PLU37_06770 [Chitinophagaceae bacterium]|nr:hypothetical protein [Chitinophagaceae bacterium]
MGSINRFDLDGIKRRFNISNFIETGTWKGDAIAIALNTSFRNIISIEIVPDLAEKAKARFDQHKEVKIIAGDSETVLSKELPSVSGNCLFWLDAHFPGADEGIKGYDEEENDWLRLPLENELNAIRTCRTVNADVIIIDDLRIYEEGVYEKGNAPTDTLPKSIRNLDFLYLNFNETHHIIKSYKDEGYILVFPKLLISEEELKDFQFYNS